LFRFPFGSLGNHQHGKNNSQQRIDFHIFALAFGIMVLNVSVSSCEELFSPAAKREAFALQNRRSSFVYF